MLAALMIGVQRAISLLTRAASGCGPRLDLAGMSQVLTHALVVERFVECIGEFAEDRLRYPLGREQGVPGRCIELGQAGFLRCRDIREGRTALGRAALPASRGLQIFWPPVR
jgi:hypothetical protein